MTIPAVSRALHKSLLEKNLQAAELSETSEWNIVAGKGKLGVITNGVSHAYVMDALADWASRARFPCCASASPIPSPRKLVQKFLKNKDKVLVVEELEPYMETEVRAVAQEAGLQTALAGKSDKLFSRLFEFDPALVRDRIARYFGVRHSAPKPVRYDDLPPIPGRPPNLCPGCPHRSTFYAVKQVTGNEAVYSTDIGCYTLGVLPPLSPPISCSAWVPPSARPAAFPGPRAKRPWLHRRLHLFPQRHDRLADAVHNKHNVLLTSWTTAPRP